MKLILGVRDAVTLGALLLRHHLFHYATDLQREWSKGEVLLRCQRCSWRGGDVH